MSEEAEKTFIKFHLAKVPKKVLRYNLQEIATNINPDTPKIQFLSLNNLLQRQFYSLCPSILLRKFFLSSKAMGKVQCPPIYASYDTIVYNSFIPCFGQSGKL